MAYCKYKHSGGLVMKNSMLICIVIATGLFAAKADAAPSIIFEDKVDVYGIINNWYGEGSQWTSWTHQNPYTGTQADYTGALGSGRIQGASLTIVLDDLDLGDTAAVYVLDKDGIWHDKDINGQTMFLNTMDFADCIFVHPGPGSPYEGHITETTLSIDPAWIGDDMAVKLAWDGWSQIEVETSVLNIVSESVHAPAPAALAMGSLGVLLVGWLRRQRAI